MDFRRSKRIISEFETTILVTDCCKENERKLYRIPSQLSFENVVSVSRNTQCYFFHFLLHCFSILTVTCEKI